MLLLVLLLLVVVVVVMLLSLLSPQVQSPLLRERVGCSARGMG
jgi:hypothetical protein